MPSPRPFRGLICAVTVVALAGLAGCSLGDGSERITNGDRGEGTSDTLWTGGTNGGDRSGSDATASRAAPQPPKPKVSFDPLDGDTHTSSANHPLLVRVRDVSGTVESSTLQALQSEAELIEWSDKSVVSVQKVVTTAAGDPVVELRPTSNLSDKWYALRIPNLPSGLEWHQALTSNSTSGGSRVARFRPDSHPLALGVQVCPNSDGTWAKVLTLYSERVTRNEEGPKPSASQPGTEASCSAVPSEQPAKFECRPYVPNEDLNLTIPRGALVSTTGTQLPAVDWTVDTSGMENGRCHAVRKTDRLP